MITPLYYQKDAIEFFKAMKKVYFAMGLGTGKTLTSLWGATEVSKKNVLVIAELNEIENSKNFEKEVNNHIGGWNYLSLRDVPEVLEAEMYHNVCGINPEMLSKLPLERIISQFDVVIVDEATLAKTTTTDKFKTVLEVCQKLEYVILLSGTPMMNGASELFAPLALLGHPLAGNGSRDCQIAFDEVFAGGHKRKIRNSGNFYKDYIWFAKDSLNIRELRFLVEDRFFFVRKEDTTGIFKKKERSMKYVPMNLAWQLEYNSAWVQYVNTASARLGELTEKQMLKKMENISEMKKIIENSQIVQVNSKWKAREIISDVNSGMYGEEPVLVFCHYQETESIFVEEGGAMLYADYTADRTQKPKIVIAKLGKHAKGGNLPELHTTLFDDMSFIPSLNLQAENRTDRPEQTRDMKVVYYTTKDERVDARIRSINQEKMKHIEEFMRPFCEEELLTMEMRVSALKSKFYKQFNLLDKQYA